MNRTVDHDPGTGSASSLDDSSETWAQPRHTPPPPPPGAPANDPGAGAEPRRSWRKAQLQGVARNVQLRSSRRSARGRRGRS